MRRKAKLLHEEQPVSSEDLAATGLSATEMKFLRDIFQSEPNFYRYLTSPFLLKELKDNNLLLPGHVTDEIIRSAHYTPFRCEPMESQVSGNAVRIAFLPSMTKEFVYGKDEPLLSEYGFKPTEFLEKIFDKLQREILKKTLAALKNNFSKRPCKELTKRQWRELCRRISQRDIAFYVENQKPLVIYPENAARVVQEVCPEADFTVILMGKNIDRAIFFDPDRDAYPFVNRIYLDIMDIEYNQASEEIEMISQFIISSLKNRIPFALDCQRK
jgi:hypothetical protein